MTTYKLCPHCGSKAEYDNDVGPGDDGFWEFVRCTGCGQTGSLNIWNQRSAKAVDFKKLEWKQPKRIVESAFWYAKAPVTGKEYYIYYEEGQYWPTWDVACPPCVIVEEAMEMAQTDFETTMREGLE